MNKVTTFFVWCFPGQPEEGDDPEGSPGQTREAQWQHATRLEESVRGLQVCWGVGGGAWGGRGRDADGYPSAAWRCRRRESVCNRNLSGRSFCDSARRPSRSSTCRQWHHQGLLWPVVNPSWRLCLRSFCSRYRHFGFFFCFRSVSAKEEEPSEASAKVHTHLMKTGNVCKQANCA